MGAKTHFQIEGIRPFDLTEGERNRLIDLGIDPYEINFEGTELEKKVAVKGTSEAIIREFMDNCLVDQSGTLPAKSIIFAISKKHARRLWEAFERLYPEHKGTLTRIIISDDPRTDELIKAFKTESMPRIAISVDMLDTGINVPEVCNLVFAKPVFSKIKFWQMLGRGTRSEAACAHRGWLPEGKKEYFKVFDFWGNFEYWKMNPEGVKNEPSEAITNRIFLVRLKQLSYAMQLGDERRTEEIKQEILNDISSLPYDSINIRENAQDLEKARSPRLWDNIGLDPIEFLTRKIMPLMRFRQNVNLNEATFTLRCEQLGLALLQHNRKEIERLKPLIGEMMECLPQTINQVRAKRDFINSALSRSFWDSLTYEKSQHLIAELGQLMPLMQKEPKEAIVIDMSDAIQQRTVWDWAIIAEKESAYIIKYREKVEERIRQIADKNPVIHKIEADEELSESDLQELENTLFSPELIIEINELTKASSKTQGMLVDLIRQVLGFATYPKPDERIRDAFQTFIISNNKAYSADQLNFIQTIQSVFLKKRHIEQADFWEPPFTNFGINAPVPMFSENDISSFVGICGKLERELFTAEA